MNVCLRFPKLSLVLLIGIVFQSCSKDTDLLSEYIIQNVGKTEDLSVAHKDYFIRLVTYENVQIVDVSKPFNDVVIYSEK